MNNLLGRNKNTGIFLLFVLSVILFATHFFQPIPQISAFNYSALPPLLVSYPYLNRILALVFLFITGILANAIGTDKQIYPQRNSLPLWFALFFTAAAHFPLFLSPLLIANLFLLLSIRRLLRIHQQKNIQSILFDASVFIGIAALIYPPFGLFILGIYFFYFLNRPFRFREFLVPIVGVVTPFYLFFVLTFYFDMSYQHPFNQEIQSVEWPIVLDAISQKVLFGFTFLLGLISLFFLVRVVNRSKVVIQYARKFILFLLFNALLALVVGLLFYPAPEVLWILIVPVAFLFPFGFTFIDHWMIRWLFYFWLMGVAVVSNLPIFY